jgi:hypothetical protein
MANDVLTANLSPAVEIADRRATMVFDTRCRVVNDPGREARLRGAVSRREPDHRAWNWVLPK